MAEQIAEYLIIEPEFKLLISIPARVHKLWTGAAWAEGPVYFRDGDFLLFSDIPNNRMMRFVPDHTGLAGTVSVYRQPRQQHQRPHPRPRGPAGLLRAWRPARHPHRATTAGHTLADSFNGKRLNSPNDVVVKSDGIDLVHRPGLRHPDATTRAGRASRNMAAATSSASTRRRGELRVVADDFVKPNGIAFSPDEKMLYIADTGATHDADGPRHIRAFDVADGRQARRSGRASSPTATRGLFDGFRLDTDGRIWTSDRRRRPLLRAGRHADRQDPGARDRRQRLLRRPEAQPPLHLRHDLALRGLHPRQRLPGALSHRANGRHHHRRRRPRRLELRLGAAPARVDCLVLDRAEFPRLKLCAGWITPAGAAGPRDRARRVSAQLADLRVAHDSTSGRSATRLRTSQHSIRRIEFDAWLLQRSGADGRHPQCPQDRGSDDGWYVIDGAYRCRWLVGAGGTRCPVYRTLFRDVHPAHRAAPGGRAGGGVPLRLERRDLPPVVLRQGPAGLLLVRAEGGRPPQCRGGRSVDQAPGPPAEHQAALGPPDPPARRQGHGEEPRLGRGRLHLLSCAERPTRRASAMPSSSVMRQALRLVTWLKESGLQ